ncbi:NAD-dependent epimerase/dehydratase [Thermocrinis albus DSM 14484]|uniref:NAD-dependent epimerase/dehydratase n=1 Tax=Thermocrinis albus (strain DSM 14484 / JCM 11386 / HI 11/12) TaxID=638303 RepID=D3SMC4_THEAH|nr:complex I NDUFA9 subunit family protein [Thermocrinis albus]ADC89904.1 NAD-dependent epimerase/dehydratase [Thermocrinis albus DSM 14484]
MEMSKRVLVTGATGFVGRYIVRGLLEKGYKVGALVRDTQKLNRVFDGKVEGYKVDFLDEEAIRKAVEDFSPYAVVHLIGILLEDKKRGYDFYTVHFLYSKVLYSVLAHTGVRRVLHMSSLGTHRDAPSMYHRTKYMAEEFLKTLKLDFTIFRPSMILGPEQRLFSDMWRITKYIPVVPLPGGGHYLFQPVDVRDVACAFVESLEDPSTFGKTYELCGPQRVSFRQLMKDTMELLGRKVVFLPVPKSFMYTAGLLASEILSPPPFSSDQILMMWRDNVCGLDPDVEKDGVRKICKKEPVPYEEAIRWSVEEFRKSLSLTS